MNHLQTMMAIDMKSRPRNKQDKMKPKQVKMMKVTTTTRMIQSRPGVRWTNSPTLAPTTTKWK